MSLARDVTTVGGATLGSRLLAFARDMGIAAVLGAGAAGPDVGLAGRVAIVAAALNAQGRVGAAALGVVTFNAVLLGALAWVILADARAPTTIGATLAAAIALAGIAQLIVTGVGFAWLRGPSLRPSFALSAD